MGKNVFPWSAGLQPVSCGELKMSFRQALAMSGGSYLVFVERPITVAILGGVVVLAVVTLVSALRKSAGWRTSLGLGNEEA